MEVRRGVKKKKKKGGGGGGGEGREGFVGRRFPFITSPSLAGRHGDSRKILQRLGDGGGASV